MAESRTIAIADIYTIAYRPQADRTNSGGPPSIKFTFSYNSSNCKIDGKIIDC